MDKEEKLDSIPDREKPQNIKEIVDQTSKALSEALLLSFSFEEFKKQHPSENESKAISEEKLIIGDNNKEEDEKFKEYSKLISVVGDHKFDKSTRNKVKKAQEDLMISFMSGPITERNKKRFRNAQTAITDKYSQILTNKLRDIAKFREDDKEKMKLLKEKTGSLTKRQKKLMKGYYQNEYNGNWKSYSRFESDFLAISNPEEQDDMNKLVEEFYNLIKTLTVDEPGYLQDIHKKESLWNEIYSQTNNMSNKLMEYVDKSLLLDTAISVADTIHDNYDDERIEKYNTISESYGKDTTKLSVGKYYEYKLGPSFSRPASSIMPVEAFACLHNCLKSLSEDMKEHTGVLQSSTSMFLNQELNFNDIPGDVDVSIPRSSFFKMWGDIIAKKHPILNRLKDGDKITVHDHNQNGKPVVCDIDKNGNLVWNPIYKYNNNREMPANEQMKQAIFNKLIEQGNIVLSYDVYNRDDIGINVEIFSEGPAKKDTGLKNSGFVQPEEKDKNGKVFSSLYKDATLKKAEFIKKAINMPSGEIIEMNCMSKEMLSKYYIINLVYEIVLGDRVDTPTTKIKYNARLRNIFQYLDEVGINIENIVEKITETISYFHKQGTWDGYVKRSMDAWYGDETTINKKYLDTIKILIAKDNSNDIYHEYNFAEYKDNIISISKNFNAYIKNEINKDKKNILNNKSDQEVQNGLFLEHFLRYGKDFIRDLKKIRNKESIIRLLEKPHFASYIMKAIQYDSKDNKKKYEPNYLDKLFDFHRHKFVLTPPGWELLGTIKKQLKIFLEENSLATCKTKTCDTMKVDDEKKQYKGLTASEKKKKEEGEKNRALKIFNNELLRHKTELKYLYNTIRLYRLQANNKPIDIYNDLNSKKSLMNENALINVMGPRLEAIKKEVNNNWSSIENYISGMSMEAMFEYIASYHIFLKYYYNSFYGILTKEEDI